MTLVRRGALGVLGAAAVVAVVVGVAFTGAAGAVVLRDPGPLVRWGLPVVETLSELAASLTVGALVLAVCVLPRRTAGSRTGARGAPGRAQAVGDAYPRSLLLAAVAAGTWTVLSVLHLVLAYAQVAGTQLTAPSFGDEIALFVTQIDLGRTLLSVTTVAAVVTAVALVVATPTGAAWTAALALVALWQLAQTGHAAGSVSHDLAVSAMVLHLVGAAVWIGALAALALLVGVLRGDASTAVARYSPIAAWCLVGVSLSGIVNGIVRLDDWSDLGSRYGLLLVAKVVLTGALALLGLAHRRITIPRLRGGDAPAPGRLAGLLFWRVVLVELAVMGAVSGVAVALGSSPPPVPDVPAADTSPAFQLTGSPLPPEPTAARWLTVWQWDVLLAAAALAGLVVYLRWVVRLRRRGDAWPWLRTVSFVVGMLVFAWTTSGGPAVYGHVLFSAHMIQHMVLVMVVPLFIALSAPVTLALRALPVRSAGLGGDDSRGPREWVLVLVHSRVGRFLAHPVVAAVNFAGSMVLFYYSGLFGWALRDHVGHLAMVIHFSVAGYLFVNALAGIDPGPTRPPYPMRLLLLFATMAFHAFFGVALVDGESLLVADWYGLMGRPWGPSALRDQQLGGSVAWGIGEIPTLALAVLVAIQWTRDDERTARRRDRRTRDGDTELDEYNAMLGRLAERDARR